MPLFLTDLEAAANRPAPYSSLPHHYTHQPASLYATHTYVDPNREFVQEHQQQRDYDDDDDYVDNDVQDEKEQQEEKEKQEQEEEEDGQRKRNIKEEDLRREEELAAKVRMNG